MKPKKVSKVRSSGVVGVKLLGEAARLMAPPPPPVILFLPLGLGRVLGTRVMSLAQHAMTVGHCAIHLGGWGRLVEFKV